MRKDFLKTYVRPALWLALVLVLMAPGCRPSPGQNVHHVILVWFPEETPQEQITLIKEETLKLKEMKTVLSISAGEPLQSERPIVDDSFDLGIHMSFASVEAMNQYLTEPRHQAFVEKYIKGKVKKIVVYDF